MSDSEQLLDFSPLFSYAPGPPGPGAVSMRMVCTPDVMDRWTEPVRADLTARTGRPIQERVAVSTAAIGLFARLLSPPLGATVLGVRVSMPDLDRAWMRPVDRGRWPVGVSGPLDVPDLGRVVTDVALPLIDAITDRYTIARRILVGNVAAAAFAAAGVIERRRPDLAEPALTAVERLLDGPLAGAGSMRPGRQFVRSSCCLYYRVTAGYCDECVLAHR